jgi:hypothetical protein
LSRVDGLESRVEGGFNGLLNLGRVDVGHEAFGIALPNGLVTDAEGLALCGRFVVREFGPVKGLSFQLRASRAEEVRVLLPGR